MTKFHTTDALTMQTYTGLLVNPLQLHLEPHRIMLDDICHALALINRYGGHTPYPYSVAQHSLLVGSILPPELRLWGLLHDAAEAYLGDMIAPLKRQMHYYGFCDVNLTAAIAEKYRLPWPMPPDIKTADLAVGAAECLEFGIPVNAGRLTGPAAVTIEYVEWETARDDLRRAITVEIARKVLHGA